MYDPVQLVFGAFFLWVGWYGFNPGSTGGTSGPLTYVMMRTVISTTLGAMGDVGGGSGLSVVFVVDQQLLQQQQSSSSSSNSSSSSSNNNLNGLFLHICFRLQPTHKTRHYARESNSSFLNFQALGPRGVQTVGLGSCSEAFGTDLARCP